MFLLIIIFLLLTRACPLETTSFAFPRFEPDSCTNGYLVCTGSVTARDGYLNITPEPDTNKTSTRSPNIRPNQVGRVLYAHPIHAWPAVISTTFTVRISTMSNSTVSGDGMAFLFAESVDPSPSDSYGSYIGILDRSTSGGVVKQLALELDTYMNEFDPDSNHIAIDTTSTITPVAIQTLNTTGVDLKSGRDITVRLDYDGCKIQVSVAYYRNPLIGVLNHSIRMSDTVPTHVYVGFSGSTGPYPEVHQLVDWTFTSVSLPSESFHCRLQKDDDIKTKLVIVIPIATALLIVTFCVFVYVRRPRGRKVNGKNKGVEDIESRSLSAANIPKMFTYKELRKATNNFDRDNLLGVGGFGSVYKGVIVSDTTPNIVAVKKMSATSKQGEREYLAEICTIGRMRHKNIVQLLGWCHEGENLLLIYQYMENGSLDCFIGKKSLAWSTRYNILTGLASSLLYLHEECGAPVVHRDVKPNNVMLDSDYNACLGDFGLARLLHNDSSVTTMLAGTPGYLAPEVGFTCKATPESDVYSFGMVVLEVVCGRRSRGMMEENSLVDQVWSLYGQDALIDCLDPKLEGKFDEQQVKRALVIGLACLHPDATYRPKIRKVVHILLNPNEALMKLPDSRPTAIYVSVSSSATTTTDFHSRTASSFAHSPGVYQDEIAEFPYDEQETSQVL